MKKLLAAVMVLPFLATIALAGQPLTDQQMDRVTAGLGNNLPAIGNASTTFIAGLANNLIAIGDATATLTDTTLLGLIQARLPGQ